MKPPEKWEVRRSRLSKRKLKEGRQQPGPGQ